jgi:hypothetical protein
MDYIQKFNKNLMKLAALLLDKTGDSKLSDQINKLRVVISTDDTRPIDLSYERLNNYGQKYTVEIKEKQWDKIIKTFPDIGDDQADYVVMLLRSNWNKFTDKEKRAGSKMALCMLKYAHQHSKEVN